MNFEETNSYLLWKSYRYEFMIQTDAMALSDGIGCVYKKYNLYF